MKFSQIFLIDKFYINKIIEALNIRENDIFLEIGPGDGTITYEILKKGAIVIAIEIDYNLFKMLNEKFSLILGKKFYLYNEDFLKFNLNKLDFQSMRFFSNLPYHITHDALFKILKNKGKFIDIHIMLQKEVSEKLLKEKNYLHFLFNYHFEIYELFKIPPWAFVPKVSVFSSFLRMIPRKNLMAKELEDKVFEIIKRSFLERRKKLKNTIKIVPEEYSQKRPEELEFKDFVEIALYYLQSSQKL
ncbi:MAG: 16S rRNA (adenine(1518)-N(6)/adenine(1519)-N(6))-dimethyltransferase RsmA [candidate division WOR-3 bacterium]|nr:16S rRNA (adenine(1518)-N(6)/adenine(1519)-N(6))-dimethyltransferase RsmA [candidate division WOR-3 bacterium]MCX7947180.1 16S rRNA (adenine(1518)-N(6)/adenine(1519)-N(6))-dimethyltransferase RsmA [candidate division WOR-3 bacterium]MDW8150236.1 16S rRNA (adenine(1518)-N(6)/adenine(1519)-N(6))-dimethyltransferase RsmA [candidate division WOR-3 bacterium]